jgi:hypothetical protein
MSNDMLCVRNLVRCGRPGKNPFSAALLPSYFKSAVFSLCLCPEDDLTSI